MTREFKVGDRVESSIGRGRIDALAFDWAQVTMEGGGVHMYAIKSLKHLDETDLPT